MFYRIIPLLISALSSIFIMDTGFALVPLESLVLGEFKENYSEHKTDPLNYVFTKNQALQSSHKTFQKDLALYRGFYEEGKNLANFCKEKREIRYGSQWEKVQVMRATMSLIQYIGLDLTARALPQYAKALEFTRDEYVNLVDGLVGNYCSTNLSVISKKELRNNLLIKFDKENNFVLPTVEKNPLFPDNIDTYWNTKTALEQEFKFTVKIFQSICSWNGNPMSPGLMVPILKNPALMSFFFRQMDNRNIEWKELDNTTFSKQDSKTVQVWCDNLICRKSSSENFYNKVYYSVGGTNLTQDLQRLYCEEWSTADYKAEEYDDKLAKFMNSMTFDEENFIASQLIALITGIPDFLLRLENFKQGEDLLRATVDYTWSKWARAQTEELNRELFFEEPITIELVDRQQYFDLRRPHLRIAFDVNLGEFDRINQRLGKVTVSFKLHIQKSFLNYYREALKHLSYEDVAEKERLLKRFKQQMNKFVTEARDKFIIPPWKGDLETIIARELTEQLMLIADKNFILERSGTLPINVELNYGPFALKYINHQKTMQNSQAKNAPKSK